MALSTLALVRDCPGIPAGASDGFISQLLAEAIAAVKKYTKRHFDPETLTEYYDGNGMPDLVLRQRPVVSISEVRSDPTGFYGQRSGGFPSTSVLNTGADYILILDSSDVIATSNSGLLRRIYGSGGGTISVWDFWGGQFGSQGRLLTARQAPFWYRGYGNVKVTYVAGYAAAPADLTAAVNELTVRMLQLATRAGPLASESYQGYSYSLLASQALAELGTVQQLLNGYKEKAA